MRIAVRQWATADTVPVEIKLGLGFIRFDYKNTLPTVACSTRLSAPESLFTGEANAGAQRPHELDVAFLVRIDEAVTHHEVDEPLHVTEPGGRDGAA